MGLLSHDEDHWKRDDADIVERGVEAALIKIYPPDTAAFRDLACRITLRRFVMGYREIAYRESYVVHYTHQDL